jgi:hypothetical protein
VNDPPRYESKAPTVQGFPVTRYRSTKHEHGSLFGSLDSLFDLLENPAKSEEENE